MRIGMVGIKYAIYIGKSILSAEIGGGIKSAHSKSAYGIKINVLFKNPRLRIRQMLD